MKSEPTGAAEPGLRELQETPREKHRRERRAVALTALDHLLTVAVKPYAGDRHSEMDLVHSAKKAIALIGEFESEANEADAEVTRLQSALRAQEEGKAITADTSDGYHTFRELYEYRKAYNALLFNEWASQGLYDVHKARRHHDGEPCFGGGWFIVAAQTPCGQISNHYKDEDWSFFQVPERERGNEWDGHTPQVALERLLQLAALRAATAPQDGWQDISTAPRDGSWFWVKRENPPIDSHIVESIFKWDARYGGWFSGTGWWGKDQLGTMRFTHWRAMRDQPFPAPPVAAHE